MGYNSFYREHCSRKYNEGHDTVFIEHSRSFEVAKPAASVGGYALCDDQGEAYGTASVLQTHSRL